MQVLVLSLVTNAVVIPETYVSPREEFEAEVCQLESSSLISSTLNRISFISSFSQLAGAEVVNVETVEVSHAEVLEVGKAKAEMMRQLVEAVVSVRGGLRTP